MINPATRTLTVPALLACLTLTAIAQGDSISVDGKGTATLKPQSLVVRVIVEGEAEIASDALAQFNSARARAQEAFEKLGLEGLEVKGEGPKIDAGISGQNNNVFVFGGGGGNENGPVTKVNVKETMRLKVPNIADMTPKARTETAARILDAAKDAGLKLVTSAESIAAMQMIYTPGGQRAEKGEGLISFVPAEPEKAETQAFKGAIADARKKAQALAELSGRKLGNVTSIQVTSRKQTADQNAQALKIEVNLRVVFAMQ